MKKLNCLPGLIFILVTVSFLEMSLNAQETKTPDTRGKMKPWKKGAWITGKYRNVFREAGYKQADIDAKLAKAYSDVFEGPGKCILKSEIRWLMFLTSKIMMSEQKDFPME